MSIMQRLTLIGLYNYDNKLFENLSLPDAYDKDVFIESLMIEHGEKLVLYSDYDFMKYSIGAWGRKWNLELERIAEALKAEYNPIWNYDRYEEINDVNNKSHDLNTKNNIDSVSETGSNVNNTSDTVTNTNNSQSGSSDTNTINNRNHTNKADIDVTKENITNGEVEHQISADNESTYQPQSKDITNVGKQKESTDGTKDDIEENITSNENGTTKNDIEENSVQSIQQKTDSGSSTTAHDEGNVNTSENEDFTSNHNAHMWGNVGVTTSASMVTEVIEQRMKYNLYNVACRLFANELLIGIY